MNRIEYDSSGELYISGIQSACEDATNHLDRVITVCQDSIEDNVSSQQSYDFFCMADGPHNAYGGECSYELFRRAANVLFMALEDGESVLIHCHQGASRSVSVAVASLGRLLDIPRHEAYDLVQHYRPQAHPDQLLMGHASTYIEQHTEHSPLWSEYEEAEGDS
jgi:protein-tyrosine phosphatase